MFSHWKLEYFVLFAWGLHCEGIVAVVVHVLHFIISDATQENGLA